MTARRATTIGALSGLAWASGLRGFMTQVTTDRSTVTWTGTFLWVLAAGLLVGALLGLAEHIRHTSANPRGRWLVWSPFVFATPVLVEMPIDLILHGSTLQGGIGGAALGVPAFGVLGAYAIAGPRRWARITCGLLALAPIPIWALTATNIGGRSLSITEPNGAWVALYFWSFLAVLMIATTIPLRIPPRRTSRREGSATALLATPAGVETSPGGA